MVVVYCGRSIERVDKNIMKEQIKQDIQKIADYFGVPIEYFSNNDNSLITCTDCGLTYDSSYPNDVKEHEHQHESWKRAVDKFGQLYCYYPECEKIKTENRNQYLYYF